MKHTVIAALLAAGAAFAIVPDAVAQQSATARSAPQVKGMQKVVFHVTENDPQKWNIVLNNAGNVQTDFGKENVVIEIVTHGPGINMLMAESKVTARLATAMDNNVALFACGNTMRNAKVTKADMYSGISYAPSGVSHIIARQSEGWHYLRP